METRSIGVCLINKNTNICENIASFESMEVAQEMFGNKYILALEEHGYGIGDIYKDGVWSKAPVYPSTEEKQANRKEYFITMIDGCTLNNLQNEPNANFEEDIVARYLAMRVIDYGIPYSDAICCSRTSQTNIDAWRIKLINEKLI